MNATLATWMLKYIGVLGLLLFLLPSMPCAQPSIQEISWIDEPAALQAILDKKLEKDPYARRRTALVDLNGDGQQDAIVFIEGSGFCGSYGCPLLVFQGTAKGFNLVSQIDLVYEPIIVSYTQFKGWHDLIVSSIKGDYLLHFEGGSYPRSSTTGAPLYCQRNYFRQLMQCYLKSSTTSVPLEQQQAIKGKELWSK